MFLLSQLQRILTKCFLEKERSGKEKRVFMLYIYNMWHLKD